MKKLLILIITFFALGARAQSSVYHSFPDSSAYWNEHFTPGLLFCPGADYSYTLQGDTVINSILYHKLIIPYVSHSDSCYGYHLAGYKGGIRQDIGERKVFFIPSDSVAEKLLYDFNLTAGANVNTYGGNDVISTVDSVLIGNNYRKRWKLTNTLQDHYIIEGIGFTAGPIESFFSGMPDGPSWQVTCFVQNGIPVYPSSSGGCDIITGINDITAERQLNNVVPNPFHAVSSLNVSGAFEKGELKIYNSIGIQMRRIVINNKSAIINRDGLSDGIYFYQVRNKTGQILTGKFVVE